MDRLGFVYEQIDLTTRAILPDGSIGAETTYLWNVVKNETGTTVDEPNAGVPVTRAPIAKDDEKSGDEDRQIFGNVTANNINLNNDTLYATLSAGPSNGDLLFNADGSFIRTPNADFND